MADDPTLGLQQATLRLAEYDADWARLFDREAALIAAALPGVAYDIAHIGSTSVPGLPAKPIMDIAMRSAYGDQIAEALVGIGYIDRGYRSGRLFIRLIEGSVRTHNLHLYDPEDRDYRDQLRFRDALRDNVSLRDAYADLKRALVAELGDGGRREYTDRKTKFVRQVLQPKGR